MRSYIQRVGRLKFAPQINAVHAGAPAGMRAVAGLLVTLLTQPDAKA